MSDLPSPATAGIDRRTFLSRATLSIAAGVASSSCDGRADRSDADPRMSGVGSPADSYDWGAVRSQFSLSPDWVHLSALLVSSHPRAVREAIERYRRGLDADPVNYLEEENDRRRREVQRAAARYLGVEAAEIALTDSTTMGIALVYHGLRLRPDDEVLTTEHDYYATHESLRLASARTGARVVQVRLHQGAATASADEIVGNLLRGITPRTRAVALTWVHSSTGLKLPLREISRALGEINRSREESERVLICVDGVHGFGVEDLEMTDLGLDFFMAGCHKWLFAPRGTGIVWGTERAWARVLPVIPSFTDGESWNAWAREAAPEGPTTAARMSPGGFKAFEHQWAVADAFHFHQEIGKSRIAARTHELNRQLKEGLARMSHVRLYTPLSYDLSAGIVAFDVDGKSARAVVERLRDRRIVATTSPYAESYPRLTPSIYNTPEDIELALQEIRAMA